MDDWVNTTCRTAAAPAPGDRYHAPVGGLLLVFPALLRPAQRHAIAAKEALDYWMPVDWYNGGMDTTLHLLYSGSGTSSFMITVW
jgi:leucyl-tRNA synthetase